MVTQAKSALLDFLRWISALLVVLGHTAMVNDATLGIKSNSSIFNFITSQHHSAVIVFFLLSGYLITYTSQKHQKKSKHEIKLYLLNRLTRIYIVLIPAIILTLALDQIGKFLFPLFYLDNNFIAQNSFFIRLFVNVFSLQGTWGYSINLGSNASLWSIGYEVSFYLFFALIIYYRQQLLKNRTSLLLLSIFIIIKGWLIIAYLLLWLLGGLAYKASQKVRIKINPIYIPLIVALLLLSNYVIYTLNILDSNVVFIKDFFYAVVIAVVLTLDFKDLQGASNIEGLAKSINKTLANFSFSLYAIHLPLLNILYCTFYYYNARFSASSYCVFSTIICVIFAYLFSLFTERNTGRTKHYFVKKISPK